MRSRGAGRGSVAWSTRPPTRAGSWSTSRCAARSVASRRRQELTADVPPDRAMPAHAGAQVDSHDELLGALAALPPRQRAVIVLRYFLDLPEAEVAAALKCSLGTVKSTASRGLARLEQTLRTTNDDKEHPDMNDQLESDLRAALQRPRRPRAFGQRRSSDPHRLPTRERAACARRWRSVPWPARAPRPARSPRSSRSAPERPTRSRAGPRTPTPAAPGQIAAARASCSLALADRRAAAQARRHARSVHVLGLRRRELERRRASRAVVHRVVGHHRRATR